MSSTFVENYQQSTVYDRCAPWYSGHINQNHIPTESVIPAHSSVLPAMQAALPPAFQDGNVLDICCGTGLCTRFLRRIGVKQLAGIDISSRLIAEARAEEQRRNAYLVDGEIAYLIDDVTGLATQLTSSVDVITCCLGITDVADLAALYATVARVLRPGGVAIFSLIHPCAPCSTAEGGLEFLPIASYHEEQMYMTRNQRSVRGRVPTYHRPLSTYLTQARQAGLHLDDLIETPAPASLVEQQSAYQSVPYGLVLKFAKVEV